MAFHKTGDLRLPCKLFFWNFLNRWRWFMLLLDASVVSILAKIKIHRHTSFFTPLKIQSVKHFETDPRLFHRQKLSWQTFTWQTFRRQTIRQQTLHRQRFFSKEGYITVIRLIGLHHKMYFAHFQQINMKHVLCMK